MVKIFVILLPETEIEAAVEVAERLRIVTANTCLTLEMASHCITLRILGEVNSVYGTDRYTCTFPERLDSSHTGQ